MTLTFSKGDIDIESKWLIVKAGLLSMLGEGATANDADHSVTMKMKADNVPITDEEVEAFMKGLQINQHGTKLKELAQPANSEEGTPATPEIIFEKQ